jgi:hypothetical protein
MACSWMKGAGRRCIHPSTACRTIARRGRSKLRYPQKEILQPIGQSAKNPELLVFDVQFMEKPVDGRGHSDSDIGDKDNPTK